MKKKNSYIYVLMLIGVSVLLLATSRIMDPRAQPVSGVLTGEILILEGASFLSAGPSPEQKLSVERGALKLRVLPNQPAPTPAERGVRILLTPERAERFHDQAAQVEVRYAVPARGGATGLAVSLQGIGPADWVAQPIHPGEGIARFALPAQLAVNAIGLRALADTPDKGGALTITHIRITPAYADQAPTIAAAAQAQP